jgi:branched-chain amino acid transport system substrate-binding protein
MLSTSLAQTVTTRSSWFCHAASGFMEAYDKPAQDAAMIRIDEINKAGGLLGKQIEVVAADTKTDRAEGAKAGLEVLDKGADLVIVSCDYDFGSPAALAAESAGKVSFFLCAESVKAGIQGVGPHSFSASVLAAVQGATMAEWAYTKKNARNFYRLLDTWTEYNKGICDGFDWMMPRLADAKLVGEDTFKNEDASIAAQITRIKSLPAEPDAIMLCTMMPGAVSPVKQLRAAVHQLDDPQWLWHEWRLLAERRAGSVEFLRAGPGPRSMAMTRTRR